MPEDAANAQPGVQPYVQLGVHPDAQPASMDDDAPLSPLSPLRPVPGVAQRHPKFAAVSADEFTLDVPIDGGAVRTMRYTFAAFDTNDEAHLQQLRQGGIGTQLQAFAESVQIKGALGDGFVVGELKGALYREPIDASNTSRRRCIVTLRCDDALVGLAIAVPQWQMRLLLVHQDHRGRRLSQVLLDEVQLRFLPPEGGALVRVDLPHCMSSQPARALYERNGYRGLGLDMARKNTAIVGGVEYLNDGAAYEGRSERHEDITAKRGRGEWGSPGAASEGHEVRTRGSKRAAAGPSQPRASPGATAPRQELQDALDRAAEAEKTARDMTSQFEQLTVQSERTRRLNRAVEASDCGLEARLITFAHDGEARAISLLFPEPVQEPDDRLDRAFELALCEASKQGHTAVVVELLAKGRAALIVEDDDGVGLAHMEDCDGLTPFMLAASGGHVEVMHTLQRAGADVHAVNAYGASALTLAATGGHVGAIELLLEMHVEVDRMDHLERSALMYAAEGGHTAVIAPLVAAGAVVNREAAGRTPLMLAAAGGHLDTMDALVQAGAQLDAATEDMQTAFMAAAEAGQAAAVSWLSACGATCINAVDCDSRTALDRAVNAESEMTVRALLRSGAEVTVRALEDAVYSGNESLAEYLASHASPERRMRALAFAESEGAAMVPMLRDQLAKGRHELPLVRAVRERTTPNKTWRALLEAHKAAPEPDVLLRASLAVSSETMPAGDGREGAKWELSLPPLGWRATLVAGAHLDAAIPALYRNEGGLYSSVITTGQLLQDLDETCFSFVLYDERPDPLSAVTVRVFQTEPRGTPLLYLDLIATRKGSRARGASPAEWLIDEVRRQFARMLRAGEKGRILLQSAGHDLLDGQVVRVDEYAKAYELWERKAVALDGEGRSELLQLAELGVTIEDSCWPRMIEVVGGVKPPVAAAVEVPVAMALEADESTHEGALGEALRAYVPLRDAARAAEVEDPVSKRRWERADIENAQAEAELKKEKSVVNEADVRECRSRLAEALYRKDRADDAVTAARAALEPVAKTLNEEDAKRRGAPDKWAELGERGRTVFKGACGERPAEHPLRLPSRDEVHEQTEFETIANDGHDKKGNARAPPKTVKGRRWHGRQMKGGAADAAWVEPLEQQLAEWLGSINWLVTATEGMRSVVDMFALKAGVDNRGNPATTPQQNPKHADSCAPNSHAARREAWGDAHFVVFIALQDRTRLPIYPFDLDGTEEIVELDACDVFIGRGDLIHYGPEYTELNVRIHAHLDSTAAPEARRHDATHPITDDTPTAHWPI